MQPTPWPHNTSRHVCTSACICMQTIDPVQWTVRAVRLCEVLVGLLEYVNASLDRSFPFRSLDVSLEGKRRRTFRTFTQPTFDFRKNRDTPSADLSAKMAYYGRGTPWRPMRGNRGLNRGRGGWRTLQTPLIERPDSPPMGDLIETVTPEEVSKQAEHTSDPVKIQDCRLLASFNWIEGKTPSIVFPGKNLELPVLAEVVSADTFPGSPPLWKPLDMPTILDEDTSISDGRLYRDQNAARYPKYPLEPAARAVLSQTSPANFDTQAIDIFGCGSTIGNLLRFVRGDDKPFRFLVEAVGNTVFFVRRENTPDERLNWDGHPIRGYGHTFPERYTEWQAGVEGSASHQRVISYNFADLKCLVRFEADGYLSDQMGSASEPADHKPNNIKNRNRSTLTHTPNIKTHESGTLIPQHAIFDLKTRTIKKRDQAPSILDENIARLWIAQIPFFILAFHDYGRFYPEEILVQDVREKIAAWQEDHQTVLRKLGVLMRKLVQFARSDAVVAGGEHKYEVVCESPDVLEVREQGGEVKGVLCEALKRVWLDSSDSPAASDGESDASGGARVKDEGSEDEATYSDADSDRSLDYTACDSKCGYCGRCRY